MGTLVAGTLAGTGGGDGHGWSDIYSGSTGVTGSLLDDVNKRLGDLARDVIKNGDTGGKIGVLGCDNGISGIGSGTGSGALISG